MRGLRLFKHLKLLTKEELSDFESFLNIQSKDKDLKKLYEIYLEIILKGKFDVEESFFLRKLRKDQNQLDKLRSSLLKKLEFFLATQNTILAKKTSLDYSYIQEKIKVLNFYLDRLPKFPRLADEISKWFESLINSLYEKLEELKEKNEGKLEAEYYLYNFWINQADYIHCTNLSIQNANKIIEKLLLISQNLNIFYILSLLEYKSYFEYQKQISRNPKDDKQTKSDSPSELISNEQIINFIEAQPTYIKEIPLIKIYYSTFKVIENQFQDETLISDLNKVLGDYGNFLNEMQAKIPYLNLRNAFTIKYNKAKNADKYQVLKELFELYKDHLEKGYLFYEGAIPPGQIQNIVSIGIRLNELNYVHSFLNSITPDKIIGVDNEKAHKIYNFHMAQYLFASTDYGTALDYLNKIKYSYSDISYDFAERILRIKVFYELGEDEFVESQIEALRIFLTRQELDRYRVKGNNFIKILKNMIKLKAPDAETSKIDILNQIKVYIEKAAEAEWISEKIEQLKKKLNVIDS